MKLPQGNTILKSSDASSKGGINRIQDSEFRILEFLAQQHKNNRGVRGNVSLFTARSTCTSCSTAVDQFRTLFPNINVDVVTRNLGGKLK